MPIVKITQPQGWNPDLTPEELPEGAFTRVVNMRFANGYAQRFNGAAQLFATPTTTPRWIGVYQTPTARYVVHAGTDRVFIDDGITRTDITPASPFTGSIDDRWSGGVLGGILVLNNSAEVPHSWAGDTSTDLAPIPGWNAAWRCQSIVPFKNYLVALDITRNKFSRVIQSITHVSTLGTLTSATPHNLTTGDSVTISGATPSNYNGTFTITVTGATTFTFTMAATPPGAATQVGSYVVNTTARFPNMVKWSHAAVPGALPSSWDETNPALDAGEQELAETPDLLVDALPLGDDLIIYKERSAYRMSFIGQPLIFRFQRIPGESGMLARGCGVETPLGHVVLTSGDVVLMTPNGPQSIADGQVRRYIFDTINAQNFRRAFVCSNPQRFEVWVCFPIDGAQTCNAACVWNWQTKEWGFRDLPNVTFGAPGQPPSGIGGDQWNVDTDPWLADITAWSQTLYAPNEARLFMCSANPAILAPDASNLELGGAAFSGLVERSGLTFGDAYTNKLLRAVYPRVDAPAGTVLTVQVGAAMVPDQIPTWSAPVQITVGSDQKADCFALGRYLAYRISADSPWRMRSLDLDVESSGAY